MEDYGRRSSEESFVVPVSIESLPLASCILATRNRRPFLRQAIKYFLRQSYANKELIIVDDSQKSAADLVPRDDRIYYVKLNHRTKLGTKLNIGIENAHGQIIQKIDDDDYYHLDFLTMTVSMLLGHDPLHTIVGLDCFLVLIAATEELRFVQPGRLTFRDCGYCAGGTLCFFRELWENAPFRNVRRGVDLWFLMDHSPHQQIKIRNPELYIYVRHNIAHLWATVGKTDVTTYFERAPLYARSLKDCMVEEDRVFYRRLKEAIRPDAKIDPLVVAESS